MLIGDVPYTTKKPLASLGQTVGITFLLFLSNLSKMRQNSRLLPQLKNGKSHNEVCSSFKYAYKSPNVVANARCHVTKIVDTILFQFN